MNKQFFKAEFQAEKIVHVDSANILVDGRLISGNISVGQYFTFFCEYVISNSILIKDDYKPVKLEIVEIVIYGRKIDKIEEGLTARLTLKGTLSIQVNKSFLLLIVD